MANGGTRGGKRVVHRPGSTLLALALVCGVVVFGAGQPVRAADGGVVDLTGAAPATFTVRPGVQTITVTGAPIGSRLTLVKTGVDERLITLIPDASGQAAFSYIGEDYVTYATGTGDPLPTATGQTLKPGSYRVVNESTAPIQVTDPFQVLAVDDHPPTSLYDSQSNLGTGFQYVTVRDGVQIGVMIRTPNPALWGPGPYPTVVEYSGYAPSNPDGPEPGTMIADQLGMATVGVNMRGSGCSGGVFDIFSPAQMADGYDVIETIARQPFVANRKVGMIGLSYSGISQLFVASTTPPSLAAITPLSVIEDPWYEQWPGGVYNKGFTTQWLAERDRQNAPNGQNWVNKRITNGDAVCAANAVLRTQNPDFEKLAKSLEFRPADADERRLAKLVPKINVPVYLTGGWQDEQTGAKFASMLGDFTGAPVKKFTLFNGRHPDGYTPLVLSRWYEFLQMYIWRQTPRVNDLIRAFAPAIFEQYFKVPGLGFEPDRFSPAYDGNWAGAKAAYEAELPVRVLFENGAGMPSVPGAPVARGEQSFSSWPPASATARTWYLGGNGQLTDVPSPYHAADRFQFDPGAGDVRYTGTGAFDFLYPQIDSNWQPLAEGNGLSYLTDPLPGPMTVAGPGYLEVWLRSTAADADLEAVLTEVYPDGQEVEVQTGLLRAGFRTIDTSRTDQFRVEYLYGKDSYQPLPAGQFTRIRIPLFSVAHPFRAGSRLRITLDTPGRDLPIWAFDNPSFGSQPVLDDVARGGSMASKLVLPIVDPVSVPTDRPPCGSLRGQVCREGGYVAIDNLEIENDTPPTTSTTSTSTSTAVPGSSTTSSTVDPGSSTTSPTSGSGSGSANRAATAGALQATPRFTG